MFDITFTPEQVQELEVLVRARLEFIAEAREQYGYLQYTDEFITLRVLHNKLKEEMAIQS